MITRLYTGDDGQSHFEELDMDVGEYPWGELKTATGVMFRHDEPGKFIDWHVAPRTAVHHHAVRRGGDRPGRRYAPPVRRRQRDARRRPDRPGTHHPRG